MGMILCIASSHIVGEGDIVGRSGCFKFKLSANSVMRGRVNAIRTFKGLVADLRFITVRYFFSTLTEEGKLLIVFRFNLEIALWVGAYRANLRCCLADNYMSAVSALPNTITIFREHLLVFDILQQFTVTLFVGLFDSSHTFEFFCYFVETFFMSFFCHAGIHISPFIVLTVCSIFQIGSSIADGTAVKILIP